MRVLRNAGLIASSALFFAPLFLPALACAAVTLAEPNLNALSNGLVAYWPLDGDTTNWTTDTTADVSGNGNTGTLIGMSTTSSPVAGKIGGALKFNGSSAYIATAYTIPAQSSATSFTWSTWAYLNSGNNGTVVILGFRNGGTWAKITPTAFEYSGGSIISYSVPTGQWLLLTVVKNGTNFTYYENGAVVATASNSGSVVSHTFYIGGDPGFPGDGVFSGMLDDIRVYDRALSAQEVAELYAAGQVIIDHSNTASNAGINSGLAGYWTFDGPSINWRTDTVADESGNGNTGTLLSMSTTSSPTAGVIGQALKFNGTGEISETSPSGLAYGTSPRSEAAWIKITGSTTGNVVPFAYGSGVSNGEAFGVYISSSRVLNFWGNGDDFSTGIVLAANTWYDLAITTENGTSVTVYINGVAAYTGSPSGGTLVSPTGTTYWEAGGAKNIASPTGPYYFNGIVDDVRIYNRTLSAQEVAELYQMGR